MINKFVEILGKNGQPMAIPMTPKHTAGSGNAAATVVTIDPDDEGAVYLFGVTVNLSAAGRGTITATDGTSTYKWGVTDSDSFFMTHPIQFGKGLTVTVTLSAVTGATGDLSTLHAFASAKGG